MRSLVIVAATAVISAAALPAQAAVLPRTAIAGPASSGFVQTATKAFPMVKGTKDLGVASGSTPLHVVVGLAMRNRALVDVFLKRQITLGDPMFEKYFTPAQTLATFGPTGAQVQAVAAYLQQTGFKNIGMTPDNQLVIADGTVALADAAFQTKIDVLTLYGGKPFLANVTNAQVPASLGGIVTAIEGLNTLPAHTGLKHARAGASMARVAAGPQDKPCDNPVGSLCPLNEYTARGFQTAYDVPAAASGPPTGRPYDGRSTAIAIFAEGHIQNVLTDLRIAEAKTSPALPQVPYQVVYAGIQSPDVSGQDEFDLDTQTSTGIANNVQKLYIYVATSLTDSDTAVEFDRFKTDDVAKAGSASFGECEIFPELDGALTLDDTIFAEAAVQGQTIFASAGDNGTTCPVVASTGVPGTGLPFQSYPATSPYVVSVGGTTLVTNNPSGTYNSETTWVGTGGGSSTEEPSPFWQQGVVPPFDNPPNPVPGVETFKADPDVAMDADPNTGALVYVNGVATGVGGTSLSSPLTLGIWARLETNHNNEFGFAAPLLYQEYKNHTTLVAGMYVPPVPPVGATTQLIGGFHDILAGSNGMPAKPGYDNTTGLGTFDIFLQYGQLPRNYPS